MKEANAVRTAELTFVLFIIMILVSSLPVLAADEIGTVTITGEWVNVRSGPGLHYGKIDVVPQGTKLKAIDSSNGWFKVMLKSGSTGWVIDDYAVLTKAAAVTVKVDGREIAFDTSPYVNSNGRTMVPIRFVAQELGATVGWNAKEQQVNIFLGNERVILWVGKNSAQKNGNTITIDTTPVIKNGRTMVPLRFISEAFGAKVEWIEATRTVSIVMKEPDDGKELQRIATVTGNVVNIRDGAGTERYDIIGQALKGDKLLVLGEKEDREGRPWYRVALPDDREGWIAGWLVNVAYEGDDYDVIYPENLKRTVLVIGNTVNIRSGPGLNYTVISQVEKGEELLFLGEREGWYEIQHDDGFKGWVHCSLASIQSVASSRGDRARSDYLEKLPEIKNVDYPAVQNVVHVNNVYGEEIFVQANEEIKYSTFVLQNPWRLVVDIEHTKLLVDKDDWEQTINSEIVSSIRMAQFSEDTTRIVIDLKKPVTNNIESYNNGKVLSIFLEESALKGKLIVLDPGHGSKQSEQWSDPGAIGPYGTREADVVAQIAEKTAAILTSRGATVIITRSADTVLSLDRRSAVANDVGADLFVSIHANASPNSSMRGTSVYYYNDGWQDRGEKSVKLARLIQNEIVRRAGTRDLGVIASRFRVLREAQMPSVLIETAFISNPQEEMLLRSSEFQNKIARGIAEGINAYFIK